MAVKRDTAGEAEFHRVRHLAALKAWDKRGRKKDQGGSPKAQMHRGLQQAWVARKDAEAMDAIAIKITGNKPPEIPLEGVGGPTDWRMRGPVQSRGDFAGAKEREFAAAEAQLMNQQKEAVQLGGGVSVTYKVKLEDGTKGNFKPAAGERNMRDGIRSGQQTEREAGAWDVAKIVGMDDMVAPAVERECTVPEFQGFRHLAAGTYRGVLCRWQEGTVGSEIYGDDAKKYDGEVDIQRAAMFDFVIGNTDRHHGNWVIGGSTRDGKMLLIDHGLAFSERGTSGNNDLLERVGLDHQLAPIERFAKPYIENKSKIIEALRKRGLPQAAIDRVASRIDRIAGRVRWALMRGDYD